MPVAKARRTLADAVGGQELEAGGGRRHAGQQQGPGWAGAGAEHEQAVGGQAERAQGRAGRAQGWGGVGSREQASSDRRRWPAAPVACQELSAGHTASGLWPGTGAATLGW